LNPVEGRASVGSEEGETRDCETGGHVFLSGNFSLILKIGQSVLDRLTVACV